MTISDDHHEPVFPRATTTTAAAADENGGHDDEKTDELRAFITGFYAVSDDPGADDRWAAHFAPDAVCIMGEKVARGTEEIRELRRGMWRDVASRRHRPHGIFPASLPSPSFTEAGAGTAGSREDGTDPTTTEFMVHGDLDLRLRSGDDALVYVAWAARAVLRRDEGMLRFVLYQVYMHR